MKHTFRETLVGTWRLVDYTLALPDGTLTYPLGKDATGFLMYTPDGYMSAQLMAQGRPLYKSGDPLNGSIDEMSKAANGYMAYSGKFEVNEEQSIVVHHMEVSMNPTWLGQAQKRFVKVEENRIIITTNINTAVLIWERCADLSDVR